MITAATTTDLGARLLWTGAMLAVMGVIYFGMWRSWRARRRLLLGAELPTAPSDWTAHTCGEGIYASTTAHHRWLERMHAESLGVRSRARICVGGTGILIDRVGARALYLPKESIQAISLAPGIAGKVVGGKGVLVITWTLGTSLVDTGVLPDVDGRDRLIAAAMELIDE
jgi:hypothetical protein